MSLLSFCSLVWVVVWAVADFTVFDRDLMSVEPKEILTEKVLWTIVDGVDAYSAKPQEAPK